MKSVLKVDADGEQFFSKHELLSQAVSFKFMFFEQTACPSNVALSVIGLATATWETGTAIMLIAKNILIIKLIIAIKIASRALSSK